MHLSSHRILYRFRGEVSYTGLRLLFDKSIFSGIANFSTKSFANYFIRSTSTLICATMACSRDDIPRARFHQQLGAESEGPYDNGKQVSDITTVLAEFSSYRPYE